MAEPVKLILQADNSNLIKGLKDAQKETQKLYDYATQGSGKATGVIEKEEAVLRKLQMFKKQAAFDDIKYYNQAIESSQKRLQAYENEGRGVQSLAQKIATWVGGLGLATTALAMLQKALLATEAGMQAVAISTAALEKIFSNLVNNGIFNLNKGLAETILRTKQLHELNRQDLVDKYEQAKLQRQYNELLYQAADRTKSNTERIKLYNEAIGVHNKMIDEQVNGIQERLKIAIDAWRDDPTNGQMRDEVIKLKTELENLDAERVQATRQVLGQLTGMIEQEQKRWDEAIKNIHNGLVRAVDEEIAARKKWGDAYYKSIKDQSDQQAKNMSDWQKAFFKGEMDVAEQQIEELNSWWESILELERQKFEQRQKLVEEGAKKWEDEEKAAADNILNKRKQLLDETIFLYQSTVQLTSQLITNGYERELAALERKKLMLLDIARIGGLTKQEEIDILERVENEKLEIERKYRRRQQALAITQAVIDGAAAAARAFKDYIFPLSVIIAGLAAASVAVQIATIKAQKFAKGGWTGEGGERDETGERVAGVVHEKEFVVKKGAASKYREVLEAINKEDRTKVYNSFLKLQPEVAGTVNNVTVENNGPNNRLDRINNQLYQLNRNLTPKKTSREEIVIMDRQTVIKKGQNTRVIKR